MSMIIKNKIKALKKGYPTVSDKYNVAGGIVTGAPQVTVGSLVKYTDVPGYYDMAVNLASINDVAGIVLAINVKLSEFWPDGGVTSTIYKRNEAFDLFKDGYIAIELAQQISTIATEAIAAVGAITTDTEVILGKDYYTRASSAAGKGYLNDGSYAYTLVAEPQISALGTYYELTNLGKNASTNQITPGKQVAIKLATGEFMTADEDNSGTTGTIIKWPGAYYTGLVDGRLAEIEVRRV